MFIFQSYFIDCTDDLITHDIPLFPAPFTHFPGPEELESVSNDYPLVPSPPHPASVLDVPLPIHAPLSLAPSDTLPLLRPTRTRQLPSNYYTGLPSVHAITTLPSSPSPSTLFPYPIYKYLSYDKFNSSYNAFVTTIAPIKLPYTFAQAAPHPEWLQAIKIEIVALDNNHTWDLVPPPPNQHIVDCKWLFKIKYLPDGSIDRFKARLIARGFTQISSVDYFDTFAPVAKMVIVRLLLSVVAVKHWSIYHMDVTNAFLHGDLQATVYMKLPSGYHFLSSNSAQIPFNLVCKLKKSLYGLKQAPREWFVKLSTALLAHGFKQSHSDNSLFTLSLNGACCVILIYVDDILITGSSETFI